MMFLYGFHNRAGKWVNLGMIDDDFDIRELQDAYFKDEMYLFYDSLIKLSDFSAFEIDSLHDK